MDKFHKGDRVELTRTQANQLQARKIKDRVNWLTRKGTVQSHSTTTDTVIILWDGRSSVDIWPSRAVVKIEEKA